MEGYNKKETDLMHDNLEQKLSKLSSDVEKGFKGVYQRQDKTNGRLSKAEWRQAMFMGGLMVLSIVVLPIAGWVLLQIVETL